MVTISDTAFLAQSRYILLESMMMWFAFMAVLSVLKMRRYRLVYIFGKLDFTYYPSLLI